MAMPRKPTPRKVCGHCKMVLERKRFNGVLEDLSYFNRRVYCGRMCMAAAMVKEKVTLSGLRSRARKFRKTHCEICKTTKTVSIHHLDGNPANNSTGNLMTLCNSCHQKWHWKNGRTLPRRQSVCKICGMPARKLDMCQKHYQRFRKYGDPCLTKKPKGRPFVLCNDTCQFHQLQENAQIELPDLEG